MIRNVSIVAVAQAFTSLATFGFTLAQARYLSPERFAELSLALSYATVVAVVVDFGLSTKLARDVAQRPATAGQALIAALVVRIGIWCLAMPALWATTVILGYRAELQTSILILGISLLFGGIALSLAAYFQGREQFVVPSLGSVVQRGSAAVLGVATLALGQGIIAVATVYVVSTVLQILVMVPGVRRQPFSSAAPDLKAAGEMFRGAAVLGFFWILGAIYYNVDILILQQLVPLENVAWYAAAYRLFNTALMVIGVVLGTVLYPAVSRLFVASRDELRQAMERVFVYLFATGVFVALVLAIAADHVVALLYPAREYAEAATALRLLAPGVAAMYGNGVFFIALLAMGFERRLLVMAGMLAVLNPLANLVLIPVLQQNGAAILTSGTEAIVLVWILALTPIDLRRAARPSVIVKVLGAAVPAATCLWLTRDHALFIGVPLAGVVYAIAALGLGIVPPNDVRTVRELLRGRRAGPLHPDAGQLASARTAEP